MNVEFLTLYYLYILKNSKKVSRQNSKRETGLLDSSRETLKKKKNSSNPPCSTMHSNFR